jgi:hypothetical protein
MLTQNQKNNLDRFMNNAIYEGVISRERADLMTYQQKQDYKNWLEFEESQCVEKEE